MKFDCPKCHKGEMWRWSSSEFEECDSCDYKIPKPK